MPQRTRRARRETPGFSAKITLFQKGKGKLDKMFLIILALVVGYGLIVLFSASYTYGFKRDNNSYKYILQQMVFLCVGVIMAYIISRLDYRMLRRFTMPFYIMTIVMLIMVFIPGIGVNINNCNRWINVLNITTFQPSEMAKMAMIMVTAHLTTQYSFQLDKLAVMIRPFLYYSIIAVLLYMEPHNSALILIALIILCMLWLGGASGLWFSMGAAFGVVGGAILLLTQTNHVAKRLSGWLAPFSDVQDKTRQIAQSLYGIGSGGLFGLGIGNSNQKQQWLTEGTNDFIFSILCEELGFVGAVVCMLLFFMLIIRGYQIALRSPDRYGALLAMGVMSQITLQVLMNIAVVTNTMPNTGISLPFFSSGGTSLVMLLIELGVVLSVDRAGDAVRRQKQQKEAEEREKRVRQQEALAEQMRSYLSYNPE